MKLSGAKKVPSTCGLKPLASNRAIRFSGFMKTLDRRSFVGAAAGLAAAGSTLQAGQFTGKIRKAELRERAKQELL